jgi:hypothetical protein
MRRSRPLQPSLGRTPPLQLQRATRCQLTRNAHSTQQLRSNHCFNLECHRRTLHTQENRPKLSRAPRAPCAPCASVSLPTRFTSSLVPLTSIPLLYTTLPPLAPADAAHTHQLQHDDVASAFGRLEGIIPAVSVNNTQREFGPAAWRSKTGEDVYELTRSVVGSVSVRFGHRATLECHRGAYPIPLRPSETDRRSSKFVTVAIVVSRSKSSAGELVSVSVSMSVQWTRAQLAWSKGEAQRDGV